MINVNRNCPDAFEMSQICNLILRAAMFNPLRANDALRLSPAGGGGANDALRHHFTLFKKMNK